MDPRLLRYYNQELRYLREMGGEFAREFPKIAGRLGMEGMEVADPYVERLIEGCAFLAARVQLKQDAEFPHLAQRLLEMVCPNLTAPVPSMLVARFVPAKDPNLINGFPIPRGAALMGPETAMGPTRCEFRTAQEVMLTPLRVASVEYFLNAADLGLATLPLPERPRSGVRIRLELPQGLTFPQLKLDTLRFYLGGLQDVALRLHELICGAGVGVLVGAPSRSSESPRRFLPKTQVKTVGTDDADAMLPVTLRGLAGTRLMQEYFAFAQRFLFIDIAGLAPAFAQCPGNQCEIVLLFNRYVPALEGSGEPDNFALHCAPAINLFERRAERMNVTDAATGYQVIVERTAAADYEVFDVLSVIGHTEDSEEAEFVPMFAVPQPPAHATGGYYSLLREPRLQSDRTRREGPRSAYVGNEVYVSLAEATQAPFKRPLRQLSARVRCTNRDLPMFMPVGQSQGELLLNSSAPVETIHAIAGPSRPQTAMREGAMPWRLLSLLSLNYLSLRDADPAVAAHALRELLGVFAHAADTGVKRQIEGLRGVTVRPVVRRHPIAGPIAFGRGLEIRLTVDDLAFEGSSAVLLGSVLHPYFARHASMNSFVQTTVHSQSRGDLMTWQPTVGSRGVL
jgi:type VI secretion system protein ImpG